VRATATATCARRGCGTYHAAGSRPIDALVTRVTFPEGKPHGVSLALVLRAKYLRLKAGFTARAERIEHTEGLGELVPHPVDLARLVRAVERAIRGEDPQREPAQRLPGMLCSGKPSQ
jgi:hypothetical protein